jgi:aerobic carbon-monoxide dehydrogenase medium subunit
MGTRDDKKREHEPNPLFWVASSLRDLRTFPKTAEPAWNFGEFVPQGVVLNVGATDFFFDYLETAVAADEVLVSVSVPKLGDGWGHRYEKFSRTAQAWAMVGAVALVQRSNGAVGEARIGLVNMSSTPVRAGGVEAALAGAASADEVAAASAQAADGTSPTSDPHASADYRRHLAQVLTRRAVVAAAAF